MKIKKYSKSIALRLSLALIEHQIKFTVTPRPSGIYEFTVNNQDEEKVNEIVDKIFKHIS